MFAKLNHVAIISDNYAAQGLFYRALFDHSDEGAVRERLFEKTKLGDLYMADLDGILIAIRERKAGSRSDRG